MKTLLSALILISSITSSWATPGSPDGPTPVLQCIEGCQKFDYTGDCTFRTTCLQQGDCMSLTSCAHFDYTGTCTDTKVTQNCALPTCPGYPVPTPAFPITCETGCQKRDIRGDCVYTSRCEIVGRCTHRTDCERFDIHGEQCLSERVQHTCY